VNSSLPQPDETPSRRQLARQFGGLLVAIALFALLLAPLASGEEGRAALAAAALVSLATAAAGLSIASLPALSGYVVVAPLVSAAARMFPLLAFCLVAHETGGRLAAGGVVYYVLAFYMLILALETWWAVGSVSTRVPPRVSTRVSPRVSPRVAHVSGGRSAGHRPHAAAWPQAGSR
jgi:hypothetical protein